VYLKRFWIKNYQDKTIYSINFTGDNDKIKRWSMIQGVDPSENLLVLRLISICLGGEKKYFTSLAAKELISDNKPIFWSIDFYNDNFKTIKIQFKINPDGRIEPILEKKNYQSGITVSKGFNDIKKPLGSFAYCYNPNAKDIIQSMPDEDFVPRVRSSRFETIFNNLFPLTPVNEWLYRQYLNASQYQSKKAEFLYNISLSLITEVFPDISFSHWNKYQKIYFKKDSKLCPYTKLPFEYRRFINFVIDFIRQMADSKRGIENFNHTHGVLLINQVGNLFSFQNNLQALKTISEFFPNLQFIFTCYDRNLKNYIEKFNGESVPAVNLTDKVRNFITTNSIRKKYIHQYKNSFYQSRFPANKPASKDTVVLIDVDSRIPNLALMKISRFYKEQGRKVILTRDSADHCKSKFVFASCIFNRKSTTQKINKLKQLHGENLQIGGSGVNLFKRLPQEIEPLMPDYSLYPHIDFALGFLTRGCPGKCKFCVVPKKEGKIKFVASIDDLVPTDRKKVVLLDDNLLSFSGSNDLLEQMVKRGLQVNFNQALDINYLNPTNAELLIKVDSRNYSFTKRMYYFGLNSSDQIALVTEKLKLLSSLQRRQIIFICMYGYNTTLSEDFKRFHFLYKNGFSPFVQKFQPIDNSPPPQVNHYFDTDIEPLLKIKYHFNGKNFENFLKWVSKKYIEQFGKLYKPLVDIIFKYNNRQYRHRYIETLGGTIKR